MPPARPGVQLRKRAAAVLSQTGGAGPEQPIRAIQPAGRTLHPPTGCNNNNTDICKARIVSIKAESEAPTDVRQTDV